MFVRLIDIDPPAPLQSILNLTQDLKPHTFNYLDMISLLSLSQVNKSAHRSVRQYAPEMQVIKLNAEKLKQARSKLEKFIQRESTIQSSFDKKINILRSITFFTCGSVLSYCLLFEPFEFNLAPDSVKILYICSSAFNYSASFGALLIHGYEKYSGKFARLDQQDNNTIMNATLLQKNTQLKKLLPDLDLILSHFNLNSSAKISELMAKLNPFSQSGNLRFFSTNTYQQCQVAFTQAVERRMVP